MHDQRSRFSLTNGVMTGCDLVIAQVACLPLFVAPRIYIRPQELVSPRSVLINLTPTAKAWVVQHTCGIHSVALLSCSQSYRIPTPIIHSS